MDLIYIFLISLALAMDCFAISICISTLSILKIREHIKIPLHFGLFHVANLIIGYYLGVFFHKFIQKMDHWVAFILLSGIGIKIIIDSLKHKKHANMPTTEGRLLLLSVATSIDALVIGITFAFTSVDLYPASAVLGFTVVAISFLGLILGEKLHKLNLKYAGISGGAVLVILGIKTLISHIIK